MALCQTDIKSLSETMAAEFGDALIRHYVKMSLPFTCRIRSYFSSFFSTLRWCKLLKYFLVEKQRAVYPIVSISWQSMIWRWRQARYRQPFHWPNDFVYLSQVIQPTSYRNQRCKIFHYSDVIMGAIASQITSLTIVFSTVCSDADLRKHLSSASLAFVWEFTGTGEFPAQMASNAGNVSIWWRHHVEFLPTFKFHKQSLCEMNKQMLILIYHYICFLSLWSISYRFSLIN